MKKNKKCSGKDGVRMKEKKNYLEATVSLPGVRISLTSDAPERSLQELRRLVEAIGSVENDALLYEDFLQYELKERLSSDVTENPEIMALIKETLAVEEDYLVRRGVVDVVEEYDLVEKKKGRIIEPVALKQCLDKLFVGVEVPAVRSALVHIKGGVDKAQRVMVLDHINKRLNYPKLRVFNTKSRGDDKLLIEVILFGDFQYSEHQDQE
ncbi:hypothetical protein D6783_00625 [Candidatus Woesearchaeota archaeon]|nr:MAG: hypothetical protein D6783_00625 [Candidatus Woesearchaeota archaeon]